ncbi:prolyl oligopeptidase family serine peptidase [Flavobacterium pectinovorum]|uniref:S9 family peptidase n=1 Tax=Flavobacterium pectinovorum TaxID=29533 RepID=UPI001FAB6A32|nr:prolyl oligopeptidase family serine peptidase [Flavobacterium pectinovorum]MCI9844567.1 S9 family peptidase [Flavobacterium pectinovorum]
MKFTYFKIIPQIAVLFFILPLVTCPSWGQVVQKKQLSTEDYHLWGELSSDKISNDSKWISYTMHYENLADTLFVRNTTANKTYAYPGINKSDFTNQNEFISHREKLLEITNLNTGKKEVIPNVTEYAYSKTTDLLILLIQSADKKELVIQNPLGNKFNAIANVTHFSLSPDGCTVVFSVVSDGKYSIGILDLKNSKNINWIINESAFNFDGFVWQKDGKSFAFLGQADDSYHNTLYYYILKNKNLYFLNTSTEPKFPQENSIILGTSYKVFISDDLERVFISLKKRTKKGDSQQNSFVEIWNANDKWIYPHEQKQGKFEEQSKVAVWFPVTNAFTTITSNEFPKLMLTGDFQYAIVSNPKAYEPQFEYDGNRDFYLLNLKTNEKELFLKKHSGSSIYTIPSPSGKYIAYFKDDHWWVYNIKAKSHTNITAITKGNFCGKVYKLVTSSPYGNPGWTTDDAEILLYDQYDLWAIKPDGSSFRRLTHGRESAIQYRIADIPFKKKINLLYEGFRNDIVDLENEVILRGEGEDGKTGYFTWRKGLVSKPIIYGDYFIDQFLYNEKKETFFYRQQKFDLPPRLVFKTISSKPNLIFESNIQHYQYDWGKAKLISYQNSKKQNLKGVLLYPASYSPQKKYPMIVHIYENQSNELHFYRNPSVYLEDGFNITNLTTQDYFIFLPDIILEEGNPGISATDCVVAGTTKIIDEGLVYPNKIGLTGHSFGGYETAFIITQTNLFATAISGAAVTDLNSFYLTVGWDTGKADMWRMNKEQWRIGKSPFEDPTAYQRNSPILNINKVTTPLLLWTGKQDRHVDWHQSVEYYLALRRLGKKNITLFYTDEGHSLLKPSNQKDFSVRLLQWFDYHLKNVPPALWIEKGLK